MTEITDPTFYRTPADAIAAAPESLAYVAAFDPRGQARDALTVLDCDGSSATYGQVVAWAELPTSGNELHHFGWNACSSALCHAGPAGAAGDPGDRGGRAGEQGRLLPAAHPALRPGRHLHVRARRRQRQRRPRRRRAAGP